MNQAHFLAQAILGPKIAETYSEMGWAASFSLLPSCARSNSQPNDGDGVQTMKI
jgi:hypothetical protein